METTTFLGLPPVTAGTDSGTHHLPPAATILKLLLALVQAEVVGEETQRSAMKCGSRADGEHGGRGPSARKTSLIAA